MNLPQNSLLRRWQRWHRCFKCLLRQAARLHPAVPADARDRGEHLSLLRREEHPAVTVACRIALISTDSRMSCNSKLLEVRERRPVVVVLLERTISERRQVHVATERPLKLPSATFGPTRLDIVHFNLAGRLQSDRSGSRVREETAPGGRGGILRVGYCRARGHLGSGRHLAGLRGAAPAPEHAPSKPINTTPAPSTALRLNTSTLTITVRIMPGDRHDPRRSSRCVLPPRTPGASPRTPRSSPSASQ